MSEKKTGRSTIAEVFQRSEDVLWSQFKSAETFLHPGNKGALREEALIEFLNSALPGQFKATSGEVVDLGGVRSGQIDVIIYDRIKNAPFASSSDGVTLLAAEAILATIEVKSKLTKDECRKALGGIAKVLNMRPYGQGWARSPRGGRPSSGMPRIFSSIFAYGTDLGEATWRSKEIERVRERARAIGMPVEWVNEVIVLDRGIVFPAEGRVGTAVEGESRILAIWFFSLVNFLSREVERREALPWSEYSKSGGMIWNSELPELFDAPEPEVYSKHQIKRYFRGARRRSAKQE